MSDQHTDALNGKRPFEERVFARFDHVDSAIRDLDSRVQKLEIRAYDTKPIWERALHEIMETKREMVETKREMAETKREMVETKREMVETKREMVETKLEMVETKREIVETKGEIVETKCEIVETRREVSKRLDRIDAIVKENRADLRDVEDRLDKVEDKPLR